MDAIVTDAHEEITFSVIGGDNFGNTTHQLTKTRLPDVDQHVGICAVFDGYIFVVSTKVVFYSFLLGTARHNVIVELAPLKQARELYVSDKRYTTGG